MQVGRLPLWSHLFGRRNFGRPCKLIDRICWLTILLGRQKFRKHGPVHSVKRNEPANMSTDDGETVHILITKISKARSSTQYKQEGMNLQI